MVTPRRRAARRLGPPRRRRTAIVVAGAMALVVLVALVVGIAVQVSRQSVPYERSIDRGFAALVGPIGAESATTGQQLAATLGRAPANSRPALLSALLEEDRAADQEAAAAAASTPPAPATAGATACGQALAGRAMAADRIRRAVEGLLGGPTGTATVSPRSRAGATGELGAAARGISLADAQWVACRTALRRAPGGARLPVSAWLTAGIVFQASGAGPVAASLVSSSSLAPAPGLAIEAVSTQPPALAAVGSPPAYELPATDSASVQVVVENTGNVTLPDVIVAVDAVPAGGAAETHRATVTLTAGASSAVTITGLDLAPGSTATLSVTAGSDAPGGASASPDTLVVSVAEAASTVAVVASVDPVPMGRPVTYTATVSGTLRGAGAPVGSVSFADAGVPVAGCTALPLRDGVAACPVRYGTPGEHSITATYGGTASLDGSTSPAITETVRAARGVSSRH